jgi:hypothetical protein
MGHLVMILWRAQWQLLPVAYDGAQLANGLLQTCICLQVVKTTTVSEDAANLHQPS